MATVSYMGTKTALAPEIAQTFKSLPRGPLLDVFAGMSAIARAVAPKRNVWVNDAQFFSQVISEFQFLSEDSVINHARVIRDTLVAARSHALVLEAEFEGYLKLERASLEGRNWSTLSDFEQKLRARLESAMDAHRRAGPKLAGAYRLFSDLYAGTYFSLRQCIEIDALRSAIDQVAAAGDSDKSCVRRWMLASLGAAMSRCSNSTGHFAQYLTVNAGNANRVISKRKRSIQKDWLLRLRDGGPVGSSEWRKNNRVFRQDACALLRDINKSDSHPAIVYADPPYTSDQYSRYYHILDTLVLYDYPIVSGKGRYRPGRFSSDWSLKSKVESCFRSLVDSAFSMNAALVVSYPDNGLLVDSKEVIPALMGERYGSVRRLTPLTHHHSTMGASKGKQRHTVMEQVFVARRV